MQEDFCITKMDGKIDDEAIKGDFICITNIDTYQILSWLDKYKSTNIINYKGREFKGSINYPDVFIFENRQVLDKFADALKISKNSLEEDWLVHDIKETLSSSMGNIRIIKNYKSNNTKDDIKAMCEFIDIDSFEDKKDNIFQNRLLVKIYDINYHYREIFYC